MFHPYCQFGMISEHSPPPGHSPPRTIPPSGRTFPPTTLLLYCFCLSWVNKQSFFHDMFFTWRNRKSRKKVLYYIFVSHAWPAAVHGPLGRWLLLPALRPAVVPRRASRATGGDDRRGWRRRSSRTRTGCWCGPCPPASLRGRSTRSVETTAGCGELAAAESAICFFVVCCSHIVKAAAFNCIACSRLLLLAQLTNYRPIIMRTLSIQQLFAQYYCSPFACKARLIDY